MDVCERDYTKRTADYGSLLGGDALLTSAEVYKRMQGNVGMPMRMAWVLMNRLSRKGIFGRIIDRHDSRVYRCYALRQKEKCVREKNRKFADSHFSGSGTNAMAALLKIL